MISRAEKPSDNVPITTAMGRKARPVSQRVVAEHALEVERAEEEHAEQPGDHQDLHQLAPDMLRERKTRRGISASRSRAWRTRRRPSMPAGPAQAEGCTETQP